MTRSQRLLSLIQLLRERRRPVSARVLAERLSVSVRTIYRDIDTLNAQGATIVGEAGVGFVLKPGFLLPPMMWSANEIEALILGTRWISHLPDDSLQQAAASIRAKPGLPSFPAGPGARLPDTRRALSSLQEASVRAMVGHSG